jgi:hypothetical protein
LAAPLDLWMDGLRLHDIEPLEAISQDEEARTLFLRMAELQRAGRISSFLAQLADDPDVDDDVKGPLTEIAQDTDFLLALEEYVHRTRRVH